MKFYISKILFVNFFLFSLCLFSQEKYIKLPLVKNNCPFILVENDILANDKIIYTKKEYILSLSILKEKPISRAENKIYNFTENGIIFVNLKCKTEFKTQEELNIFFKLNSKNDVYINGYLIESPNYKIETESIVEIELINPNSENQLKYKTINIWTLTKEERIGGCLKQNIK